MVLYIRERDSMWWIMPLSTNRFLHQYLSYSWPWLLKMNSALTLPCHHAFYIFCSTFLLLYKLSCPITNRKDPTWVTMQGVRSEFQLSESLCSNGCITVKPSGINIMGWMKENWLPEIALSISACPMEGCGDLEPVRAREVGYTQSGRHFITHNDKCSLTPTSRQLSCMSFDCGRNTEESHADREDVQTPSCC